jgi:hypothetical protein
MLVSRVEPWHGLCVSCNSLGSRPENMTNKLNMIIPRKKLALEAWLAELHRVQAVSDMGSALLALQITELENKCAALRKRLQHKAELDRHAKKRCALRSAA